MSAALIYFPLCAWLGRNEPDPDGDGASRQAVDGSAADRMRSDSVAIGVDAVVVVGVGGADTQDRWLVSRGSIQAKTEFKES